jgi:hypothetical protein
MAKIRFSNGKTVNFNGTPTQQDIDEIDAQFQSESSPLNIAKGYGESFGKGVASGATFGMAGKEPLSGSVFEPNPLTRKAGQFVGGAIPLTAAAMTGGAAAGIGAEAAGASALGTGIMEGMGTGMTFEAMKGAAKGNPPIATVNEMAKTGLEFGGLGAAGQGAGYLRKVFGEGLPEYISNHFINSEKNVSVKLREQGKPSLGKQYLETDLPGFKNRNEVYDNAGQELSTLEGRIKSKLGNNAGLGVTAEDFELHPEKMKDLKKGVVAFRDGGKVISARLGQKVNGQEIYNHSDLGVASNLNFDEATPGFLDNQGNFIEQYPKSDKVINTREIADSLDKLQENYKTGTRRGEVVKIGTKKGNFLEDNPDSLTKEEAMQLKRKLDDKVAKAYLNPEGQKTPAATEVDEHLANALRSKLYEVDPELGQLAAKESLMIRIRSGLGKTSTVSKYGGSGLPHGFWSAMVNMAEGSPAANALAKGLDVTMGEPSKFIAPIAQRASQVGVTMPPGFYDQNQ